jgi:hypothetical protein
MHGHLLLLSIYMHLSFHVVLVRDVLVFRHPMVWNALRGFGHVV